MPFRSVGKVLVLAGVGRTAILNDAAKVRAERLIPRTSEVTGHVPQNYDDL